MAARRNPYRFERRNPIALIAMSVFVIVGFAALLWNPIGEWSRHRATSDLPPPVPYGAAPVAPTAPVPTETPEEAPTPFEGGISKSEHYVLETNPVPLDPTPPDPLAYAGALPETVNLAVPFTPQAPHANWDLPYQEACEEASAIMVDGYYKGWTGTIKPDDADRMIQSLVLWQKGKYGYYEDTDAEETARFMREYMGYRTVIVRPFRTIEELKRPLALGYPVMIPAAGQLLGNPYFSGDGPPYHMIVLRGYTEDAFIVNDPGTRRGESFTYSFATILNAAHDWTGDKSTVQNGARMMIVALPN